MSSPPVMAILATLAVILCSAHAVDISRSAVSEGLHSLEAQPAHKRWDLGGVLATVRQLSESAHRQAGLAEAAAVAAEGTNPVQRAAAVFGRAHRIIHKANKVMEHARGTLAKANAEKRAAKKILNTAVLRMTSAKFAITKNDKEVVHSQAAALRDLQKAEKVEELNRGVNKRMKALEHQVAAAKLAGLKEKEKTSEVRTKAKAKLKAEKAKAQQAVKKMKNEVKLQNMDAKKVTSLKSKLSKGKKSKVIQEAKYKAKINKLKTDAKDDAVVQKKKSLALKHNLKTAKSLVHLDRNNLRKGKQRLVRADRKANRFIKNAASQKDKSLKGLVTAEQAVAALSRVKSYRNIVNAERSKLATDMNSLVHRRIDVRFDNLKHESKSEVKADERKRAKKKAKKMGKKQVRKAKRREKRKERAKLRQVDAKAKAKYKQKVKQEKRQEQARLAKSQKKQKFLKKAQGMLKKAASAAKNEVNVAKEKQSKADRRKRVRAAHRKFVKKAKLAISKEFDKVPKKRI